MKKLVDVHIRVPRHDYALFKEIVEAESATVASYLRRNINRLVNERFPERDQRVRPAHSSTAAWSP